MKKVLQIVVFETDETVEDGNGNISGFSDPFSMMGVIPGKRRTAGLPDVPASIKEALESDSEDATISDADCSISPRSPAATEKVYCPLVSIKF